MGVLLAAFLATWTVLGIISPRSLAEPYELWARALLALSLILPTTCCLQRGPTTPLDLLQPGIAALLFFYFYIAFPAAYIWHDLSYHPNWADPAFPPQPLFVQTLSLTLLGLVFFGFGYRLPQRRVGMGLSIRKALSARDLPWSVRNTGFVILMLFLGLVFKLRHWAAVGGISHGILAQLSPGLRAEEQVRIAGLPFLLESLFDWGVLLLVFRSLVIRRWRSVSLALLLCAMVFAYLLTGKRSAVAPLLLFPLVWYHYLRRRIGLGRWLVLTSLALVLMASLLFLRSIAAPSVRGNQLETELVVHAARRPLAAYMSTPELATFDMTMVAVHDRGPLLNQIGGLGHGFFKYNFETLLQFFPRALWPEKPVFRDLGQVFYQWSVGGRPDVGFSIGVIAGLYMFGHIAGVAIGMFLLGVCFSWAYRLIQPWRGEHVPVLLYAVLVWMAFLLLRFGTFGFAVLYFIQFQFAGAAAVLLLSRRTAQTPGSSRRVDF